jgi:hypothetical protein
MSMTNASINEQIELLDWWENHELEHESIDINDVMNCASSKKVI